MAGGDGDGAPGFDGGDGLAFEAGDGGVGGSGGACQGGPKGGRECGDAECYLFHVLFVLFVFAKIGIRGESEVSRRGFLGGGEGGNVKEEEKKRAMGLDVWKMGVYLQPDKNEKSYER